MSRRLVGSKRNIASALESARAGVVYLVGAGPGDPDLLTLRGAELLASADVVLHDELVHPALLELATGEVRSVGKRGGDRVGKDEKQRAIESELVALATSGKSVVRLKGGDPFLFGRGSEECEALVNAGVAFEIVPGVPSPLGATAYAGISVTHRAFATSVTFVSGTTREGKAYDFSELASVTGTICVLMGMRKLDETVARLVSEAKRDPGTACAIVASGTRSNQRVVVGELATIARLAEVEGIASPAIVVVGEVAKMRERFAWFDRSPLFGKRVLVARPGDQAASVARSLRRRGAEPIVLPLISIDDPPDEARVDRAVLELGRYDLVVFTSENGVEKLFGALRRNDRDARAFANARVAAVGTGTAASLLLHGVRPDIVPSEMVGEALAEAILADEEIASRRARGKVRVLLPRAEVARDVVPIALRKAGCEVDDVPVYTTRSLDARARAELERRLDEGAIDVVLLTSSSIADAFADALGDRPAGALTIASIGPVTTRTAEKRGLTVAITAHPSTTIGLLDSLDQFFRPTSSR